MRTSPFPIISLNKLSQCLCSGGEEIGNLRKIALEDGFFYLTDHGIPEEKIQLAINAARGFFTLNEEEKLKYGQEKQLIWPKTARGYIPLRGEMFDPQMGPGCHEAFNVGIESLPSDLPFTGPNTWPPEELSPGLKDAMLELQSIVLNEIAPTLISSFALALGLHKDFFRPHFHNLILDQGANFYPPGEGTIGKHTDSGFLTLLIQEQLPHASLRVHTRGKWVDAPPIPGTMAVNIGDMLQKWSGDLFVSTPHSVLHKMDCSRVSLPFVLFPGAHCKFRPLNGKGQVDETAEVVKAIDLMLANHEAVWVQKKGQGRIEELEIDEQFGILETEK